MRDTECFGYRAKLRKFERALQKVFKLSPENEVCYMTLPTSPALSNIESNRLKFTSLPSS